MNALILCLIIAVYKYYSFLKRKINKNNADSKVSGLFNP